MNKIRHPVYHWLKVSSLIMKYHIQYNSAVSKERINKIPNQQNITCEQQRKGCYNFRKVTLFNFLFQQLAVLDKGNIASRHKNCQNSIIKTKRMSIWKMQDILFFLKMFRFYAINYYLKFNIKICWIYLSVPYKYSGIIPDQTLYAPYNISLYLCIWNIYAFYRRQWRGGKDFK